MKIIYLSNSKIPSVFANSVQVMRMCEAFSQIGHDLFLFARKGELKTQDPYRYYGVSKSFFIKYYRLKPRKKQDSHVNKLFQALLKLSVARISPHLIYSRSNRALNAILDLRIPFVFELHYFPQDIPELKRLLDDSNLMRIIVISQVLKNDILKTFPLIDSSKIMVAHDGACLPSLSEQSPKSSQEFLVGYLGSLYAGKGIDIIASIAEQCPWATFHIIGGHGDELKFWQNKFKPIVNIELHGFVPHNDTKRFLKMMNVVLAPYQNKVTTSTGLDIARWMSPLKIFEYMANGKAIVASNLEVIREILNHGNNALLVEPDNIEEWVSAIKKLYEDPNLCRRLGRQAFLDVKSHYTWVYRAKKVLKGLSPATGKP